MRVIVYKAPGFEDRMTGETVPGLHWVSEVDGRGPLSVVLIDGDEEPRVLPLRHVFTPEGLRYAEEWAAKNHSTVLDVRVPEALEVRG